MNQHTTKDKILLVIIIFYNALIVLFSILWLFSARLDEFKIWLLGSANKETTEYILFSFFYSGVLGGSFYCLRGIYERLSDAYTAKIETKEKKHPKEIFNPSVWLFWYLYRPIQSGILAIVIICLFNQGLFDIKTTNAENTGSLYFQIGIGFLIGFGTHEVICKLEELIRVLFARSSNSKPGNSDDKSREKVESRDN
jgi:magnesium-transporting ATPase (P-type)